MTYSGCDDGLADKRLVLVCLSFCKRYLSGGFKQSAVAKSGQPMRKTRLLLPLTSPTLAADLGGLAVGHGRIV